LSERIYPDNVYDPVRVKLAAEATSKELRKLLPSVPEELWPQLDHNVADWFDGTASELAMVHDFWNGCEGIMTGFKLKRLIRYFSAANVSWQTTDVAVDEIPLGWQVGTLSDELGQPPYHAPGIRELFQAKPKFLAENKQLSDEKAAGSVPRDHYPIILAKDKDGYTLLDGNRRVLRAIIYGRDQISAHIGTFEHYHDVRDYWVSTPFLRDLVRIAETGGPEVTENVYQILKQLFHETVIAKINYEQRVLSQSQLARDLFDRLLA